MEMMIDFPGGSRVAAHVGGHTIETDQPPDDSAPSPFTLFLASLGTCAGIFVLNFCRQRGLSTDGLRIIQRVHAGANHMVARVDLEVQLPPGFPEKYRDSVIRAAQLCSVKKLLEHPPAITVTTAEPAAVGG
jgi:putative redox protein